MATSDILGLFATPQQYEQQRQAAMEAQALQQARLSPMEQGQYGIALGAQQLGRAIGGALGGVDPQLKIISQRQQLAAQLDPSRPESYMQVAKIAADSGDQQFALVVADAGRQAAVQVAQANKERQLAVPAKIQEAERVALSKGFPRGTPEFEKEVSAYLQKPEKPEAIPAKIQEAERVAQSKGFTKGTPEFEKEVASYLQKPEKPEARPSVGSDREGLALEMFDKNFYDLTPEQRTKVNTRADAKAAENVPKISVNLNDPTAVAKANLDVMGRWEGVLKSGGDVEVANRYKSVKSAVAMANAGNPSADGALLYNIAKMYDPSGAVQEGDKKSITGNPAIPERFKLLVQGVLNGGSFTPTQRKDLERIADDIVKNRQSQLNVYRKQYVNKIKELKGTEQDILNPYQGLIQASPSESVNQIPSGRQSPPQQNQKTQPTPQGKVVKKWSDL